MTPRALSILAALAVVLGAVALVLLLAAPLGVQGGLWAFPTGFQLLRWAAYAGIAAGVIAIVAGALSRRWILTAVVVLAGAVAALVPYLWLQRARSVPPIHDITTDLDNPPPFVAVAPFRRDAPNPVEYAGAETADLQRRAYPDLQPLRLDDPPSRTFERSLAAARDMGWTIVASDPAAGRIEASDTTFWFRFIDDVVIRIRPEGNGSRIDVRSKSRVGRGDVGTNARRIRALFERLRDR